MSLFAMSFMEILPLENLFAGSLIANLGTRITFKIGRFFLFVRSISILLATSRIKTLNLSNLSKTWLILLINLINQLFFIKIS